MASKSIFIGIIIGVVIGGIVGYIIVPAPDYTYYEDQIGQLHYQVESLQEKMEDMVSQEAYDQLGLQITALEGSISLKDSQIEQFEYQTENLGTTVASLEYEITILEASLDTRLFDVSFSRTGDTSSILQHWISRANETIQLMVMLITQDELADALIAAHNRGIDINIIIDDEWYYSSGSDYQEILDAGIDIRGDERGGLMHHKVMIIDGCIIITGSYNWSASAEDSNDENIIILGSSTIADTYITEFDRLWKQTTSS